MSDPQDRRLDPEPAAPDASIPPEPAVDPMPAVGPNDPNASLLALVDRLAGLLERSELLELEVEAGSTGLVLRSPAAVAPPGAAPAAIAEPSPTGQPSAGEPGGPGVAAPERPAVRAPLTGIYYASPSPGSAPYVKVGQEIAVGQVIGLIEAMKLFNEIKSDLAGRVVRMVADSGQLVKARQPLIEVDPL